MLKINNCSARAHLQTINYSKDIISYYKDIISYYALWSAMYVQSFKLDSPGSTSAINSISMKASLRKSCSSFQYEWKLGQKKAKTCTIAVMKHKH